MTSGRVNVSDLVGVAEIADRLNVGTSTVHRWRERDPEFPQPIARLRAGLVWDWSDVERWARSTGRTARPAT